MWIRVWNRSIPLHYKSPGMGIGASFRPTPTRSCSRCQTRPPVPPSALLAPFSAHAGNGRAPPPSSRPPAYIIHRRQLAAWSVRFATPRRSIVTPRSKQSFYTSSLGGYVLHIRLNGRIHLYHGTGGICQIDRARNIKP